MAYCKHCGVEIGDDQKFCPKCGGAQFDDQVTGSTTQAPASNPQDNGSIGWAILGFLFPLIGLILWLVWKDEQPKNAHKAGVGALVGVITAIVFSILIVAIAIIIGVTADPEIILI